MTTLRLLSPVLVDFRVVPGAALRSPDRYAAFWAACQGQVDDSAGPTSDAVDWTFTHVHRTGSLNLYRTIDGDSTGRPVHLLEGSTTADRLPDVFPGGLVPEMLRAHPRCLSFRLFDHGIALVEVELDLGDVLGPSAGPADLDRVQEAAVTLGEAVARALVLRHLHPLLAQVRARDVAGEVVAPPTPVEDPVHADFGEPMWVTRSLVVPSTPDPVRDASLRHWLKDVTVPEEDEPPAEALVRGESDHCVRWVNYAFVEDRADGGCLASGVHADLWQGLRHAQVFYAALDRIDSLLSQVLAETAAAETGWELRQLKQHLVDLSHRAELLIMDRQRVSKYLNWTVRTAMDDILACWDHEALLEVPVRFKIETCDRRLAELATRRSARSALVTDLILLGIGVTSVVGTALAVTEFGREATGDAEQATYDLGRSSVTEWFAEQPADAILVASGAVSFLLVALYLYFRRDD